MRPYYEHAGITIYHGDCLEIDVRADALLTDPPYPNNGGHFVSGIASARDWLARWTRPAMVFWSELEHPPVPVPLVALHVWHRTNVNGRPYEAIYQFHPDGMKRRSEVKAAAAVFDGAGPGCVQSLGHPTQKNRSVMCWCVQRLEGTLLDPFMGSGTTLDAAKALGRKAIGIEIEERYCEIAAKRLSQEVLQFEAAV